MQFQLLSPSYIKLHAGTTANKLICFSIIIADLDLKCLEKGENILVIGLFLFVFCCFSVPIIIYATSSDVTPKQEFEVEIDVDNCLQQVAN